VRFGLLAGVTTNPNLIVQTNKDLEMILKDLLHFQEGPVAVQVLGQNVSEIVQQAQNFYSFSNRLIIKIPLSKNGLEALHLLSRQGIPTMATAIFNSRQVLMAALAGADYIAPYIGKIEEAGDDPWPILKQTMQLFQNYRLNTKILAASLSQVSQVLKCAELGIYGVTVNDALFEKLIEDEQLTVKCIEQFTLHGQNSACFNSPRFFAKR
jgi:TalC/MipB family fructose-6-phosphate aldolase